MTINDLELGPATIDDAVDDEIFDCLNPTEPKSFFLYAGAGSGKTRSLVNALETVRDRHGEFFRRSGQKVAVITYTNAACDEISSRLDADPLFHISTIHSFCWSQISSLHQDIQSWLKVKIPEEIAELKEKQAKGRAGTKAALDRERGIAAREKRMDWLSVPRRFTYNPNGDNFGADSLSHSEVLKITAHFTETKSSMQAVLVNRFPFLLIDESQDTSRHLIDAFFKLETAHHRRFALGLFGDMMQRIYADGKPDLGQKIPDRWARPAKKMNHRSSQRIVQLGNALRLQVDEHRQMARDNSEKGFARLFIAPTETPDKPALEEQVRAKMSEITGDADWTGEDWNVKTLTLEHHMAASRMGFADLFAALDQDSRLRTGLRAGDLPGVRLFSEKVSPLIDASSRHDEFAVMTLLRKSSPLLKRCALVNPEDAEVPLADLRQAVGALLSLDTAHTATTFMDVLECVAKHGLFDIPDSLRPFITAVDSAEVIAVDAETNDDVADADTTIASLQAWRAFLETPFHQIVPYAEYVSDLGVFSTHQGVKGLEFDRVLVIMDDGEARGFLFSYEKLFGAMPPTSGDKDKIAEGKETGMDRTRRLLYVTCTRAAKSLALIAYTNAPERLATAVVDWHWFEPAEIICL